MSTKKLPSYLQDSILANAAESVFRQHHGSKNKPDKLNKGVQTDYRENDCQTVPWEPPYQVPPGHNPEVLRLTDFVWGDGLPAGDHEIEIVTRMRMRRAWEEILPPRDNPYNNKIRDTLITDLENDEWAFREAEIQSTMDLRMELQERLVQSKDCKKNKLNQDRFKVFEEKLNKRKEREICNIKNKFSRELRRIAMKHETIREDRDKSIIKLYAKRCLQYRNPKLCLRSLQTACKNELQEDILECNEQEMVEIWKKLVYSAKKSDQNSSKSSFKMCPRLLKKNENKMLELTKRLESLKNLDESPDTCSLLKRKEKILEVRSTPYLPRGSSEPSELSEEEDETEEATEFLLTEDRAPQSMILEDQYQIKSLIDEIRLSGAFGTSEEPKYQKICEKFQGKTEEAEEAQPVKEDVVEETSEEIGEQISTENLIFLNEDLKRFEEEEEELEKKTEEEREEFDDQYVVVSDNLDSIIEKYIKGKKDFSADSSDKEETVSDMIYNFLLPKPESESCTSHPFTESETSKKSDDQLHSEENFSSYCAVHFSEKFNASESESSTVDTLKTTSAKSICCSNDCNDLDNLKNIIELILTYVTVSDDDKDKLETYKILEQVLWETSKKIDDFQLNQNLELTESSSKSFHVTCTCSSSDTE